jgi:hypothetical protein
MCENIDLESGLTQLCFYGGACGRFQLTAGRNSFEVPGYSVFKLLDFTDHTYQFWSPESTCRLRCVNMTIKHSYEMVTTYQPTRLMKLRNSPIFDPHCNQNISQHAALWTYVFSKQRLQTTHSCNAIFSWNRASRLLKYRCAVFALDTQF